jgi:hypothetical protein
MVEFESILKTEQKHGHMLPKLAMFGGFITVVTYTLSSELNQEQVLMNTMVA